MTTKKPPTYQSHSLPPRNPKHPNTTYLHDCVQFRTLQIPPLKEAPGRPSCGRHPPRGQIPPPSRWGSSRWGRTHPRRTAGDKKEPPPQMHTIKTKPHRTDRRPPAGGKITEMSERSASEEEHCLLGTVSTHTIERTHRITLSLL